MKRDHAIGSHQTVNQNNLKIFYSISSLFSSTFNKIMKLPLCFVAHLNFIPHLIYYSSGFQLSEAQMYLIGSKWDGDYQTIFFEFFGIYISIINQAMTWGIEFWSMETFDLD